MQSTRSKNKLQPDPAADGNAHTRVKRDPVLGKLQIMKLISLILKIQRVLIRRKDMMVKEKVI